MYGWREMAIELCTLVGNDEAAAWLRTCHDFDDAWARTERPVRLVVLAAACGMPSSRILDELAAALGPPTNGHEAVWLEDARSAVSCATTGRARTPPLALPHL